MQIQLYKKSKQINCFMNKKRMILDLNNYTKQLQNVSNMLHRSFFQKTALFLNQIDL